MHLSLIYIKIQSGLTQKVLESTNTREEVEANLLKYLEKNIGRRNYGMLAGNSVHQDRIFMVREFPKVIDYLHYRQVDVSSIKEVGKRHNPKLMMQLPQKTMAHTAKSDILESINELKWYYDNYLIKPNSSTDKQSGYINYLLYVKKEIVILLMQFLTFLLALVQRNW